VSYAKVLNLKRLTYALSVCGLSSRIPTSGKKLEFLKSKKANVFFGHSISLGSGKKFLKSVSAINIENRLETFE